jgi:hypothetical protein
MQRVVKAEAHIPAEVDITQVEKDHRIRVVATRIEKQITTTKNGINSS